MFGRRTVLRDAPNPATGRTNRATLKSIQIMRGIAAFAVVVYHTNLILAQPEYGGIHVFDAVASRGWTGVNFFFVLSGFIIFFAHGHELGMPQRAGRYVWRRFSRVYPLYWVLLTAYIVAAAVGIGHADFSWNPISLIQAYALSHEPLEPSLPLKVAWTLIYEVVFYAAFLVLILNRRAGIVLFAVWLTAIVINGLVLGSDIPWTHVWNLYFMIGALAFLAFKRLQGPTTGAAIFMGGLVLLAILFASGAVAPKISIGEDNPAVLLLMALGFTALLLGSVIYERARPFAAPASLMLLGEASYAIYLAHSAAISLLAQLYHRFILGLLPPELLFFLVLAISTAGGIVVHLLLEKPLLRAARHMGKRKSDAMPQPATSGRG